MTIIDCLDIEELQDLDNSLIESTDTWVFFFKSAYNSSTGSYYTKVFQIEASSNTIVWASSFEKYFGHLVAEFDNTTYKGYFVGYSQFPVPFVELEITEPEPTPSSSYQNNIFSILIFGFLLIFF
ncbi:hypothetical protein M0811_07388 [Anaeramoeba ignava]|uniref:Uncharacterized protein n=1 Tax=Anaeramoeba ignava TaxID=1746090 RepID=A0A9Q0RDB4_ANAIG|nr:hypothetical protein M0811_07388 [Anaeramoeba ignava]